MIMRARYTSYDTRNAKPRYVNRSPKLSSPSWMPNAATPRLSPRLGQHTKSRPKTLPSLTLLLSLICAALSSGCASKSPIVMTQPCPSLQPPPASLMDPEPLNLTPRLRREFGLSQPTASGQSEN